MSAPVRSRRPRAALLLASISLAACSGAPDPTVDDTAATEEPLLRKTKAELWGSTIRVCFSGAPKHDTEKAWVKESLLRTWGLYAKIDFTGFDTCVPTATPEREVSIRVDEITDSFGSSALTDGSPLPYGKGTSRKSGRGVYVGWPKDGTALRARVGSQVVHEFGHVLGFAHDQNSMGNKSGECWWVPDEPYLEPETTMVGTYDSLSIMNYCAAKMGPLLSPGDKINIGAVYGARPLRPGTSDVVWSDASLGQLAVWQMNGIAPSARGKGIWVPSSYALLGTGNFAGHSALFRDAAGQLIAWKLSGTSYAGYRIVTGATVTAAARRAVVATADMDGDGITDVLWRDPTTNEYGVWMMDDGPSIRAESPFRTPGGAPVGPMPPEWRFLGVGDFDGDGGGDIVWQHTGTRGLSLWRHRYEARKDQPDGSIVDYIGFEPGTVLPTNDTVAAIGDFDGDAVSDIAWSTPAGNLILTLTKRSRMKDFESAKLEVKATMNIPIGGVVGAPPRWTVAGTGDFDGDGTSDVLWRATDGAVGTSPMREGGVRDVALRGFGGKCLTTNGTSSANGTGLILWDCVDQANQKWTLRSDGTLRGLGGKCVSTNGTTSANGTGLVLWDCVNQANQKWEMLGDGTLRGLGGRVISTSGYTSANGTKLVLWDGLGQDNQKWSVAAVVAPIAPFTAGARVVGTLGHDPTPR